MNNIKKEVQAQFGKNAKKYVYSENHAKGKSLAKLVEISSASKEDIVLDVATGGGHVANALSPLVKQVTAFDLTEEILSVAKSFMKENEIDNVDFIQGDAENMPFADGIFDMVTCRIAAHHFPNITHFIKGVARVLKPGGTFLLVDNVSPENNELDVFCNQVEQKRDHSHYRAWKKSEWLKMLEEEGFTIEEWHRFTKVTEFESWCDRMNLPENKKMELNQYMIQAESNIKNHFQVKTKNDKVISFQGESILIKAKRTFA